MINIMFCSLLFLFFHFLLSMTEEVITKEESSKNTCGTVGMVLSIIGAILVITVILSGLWFFLLFVGLILGIIGLFKKPRGKAITAVVIPVIIFGLLIGVVCYVASGFKAPLNDFKDYVEWLSNNPEYSAILSEKNNEDFQAWFEANCSDIVEQATALPIQEQLDSVAGDNNIEKFWYLFFGYVKQCMQKTLDSYVAEGAEEAEAMEEEEVVEVIDEENSDIEQLIESIDNETEETINNLEEQANIEEVLDIIS